MKNFILLSILLCLTQCRVQRTAISEGVFAYRTRQKNLAEDTLYLKANGDFRLIFYYRSELKGQWYYVAQDTIMLKGERLPVTSMISRGYVSERDRQIKVLNKDKLKMPIFHNGEKKYTILKRVED